MLGRKINREAWIVQQERRAKRIKVRRVPQNKTDHKAILEAPTAKFQPEPKHTGDSNPMIATASTFAHTDMVFPRTTFPCHGNSTLHISPITDNSKRSRNNPLSSFNGDFMGKSNLGLATKRALGEDVYNKPNGKKMCIDSLLHGKEEVSEVDFQMALLKRSISRKKDWIYSQVLQNLGIATPDANRLNVISNPRRVGAEKDQYNIQTTPFVDRTPISAQQYSCSGFIQDKESKKVHDEEGNCYIDSEDYMSFNSIKGSSSQALAFSRDKISNGHINQESKEFDLCETTLPKRSLFLSLKLDGGFAIDHDSMPKISAIHAIKGRREHEAVQRHVQAKITGFTYSSTNSRAFNKEEGTEDKHFITKEQAKWWPPSPESMPNDVMSRDTGEGLLKVMTAEDMKAYGFPKEEENTEYKSEEDDVDDHDDDVVVTKVLKKHGKIEGSQNTHELPPLKLDANGKAANYKEILLHYIAQKLGNDSKNTCLESISSVTERPRRNMSMEQLCIKLKDTREKLKKEQLKWKQKLLSSLEVVLIKKIRRLEKETDEAVPEGIILEGVTKGKFQEGATEETSFKGSKNEIVALMEGLTSEGVNVKSLRCKKRSERNSHSVSNIRGYDSS